MYLQINLNKNIEWGTCSFNNKSLSVKEPSRELKQLTRTVLSKFCLKLRVSEEDVISWW